MPELNNNVAFGANIVTKLKGRQNVMSRIASEFEKSTANLKGTLEISRCGKDYDHAIELRLADKNSPSYYIYNYSDILSKKQEEAGPKFIKEIATKFAKILKLLKIEMKYTINKEAIRKNICHTAESLEENKRLAGVHRRNGNNKIAQLYDTLIGQNTKRIETLKQEETKNKETFLNRASKIAKGDKELEEYLTIF